MLEDYYVQPKTVDRIRTSWVIDPLEQYVSWLESQGYSSSTIRRRITETIQFGEFAKKAGARVWGDLPDLVRPFADNWVRGHGQRVSRTRRVKYAAELRVPVEQMLRLVVPGYVGSGRKPRPIPFEDQAPYFFGHLAEEKGLRPATLKMYQHHLNGFAYYLQRIGLHDLAQLSPAVLSGYVAEYGPTVSWSSLRNCCGELRVFVRYLWRQGVLAKDLSGTIEAPVSYRLSGIPLSISWEAVQRVLECVDRRTPTGRRDYAILLLLVTYGLRGREVAGLRLEDIDWRNDRLRIGERKAGHSTAYPLSSIVGEAILDYIEHGRPTTKHRQVFIRSMAPVEPIGPAAVSCRARRYLLLAGVRVPRPGSHTLRHTCVQRLVDADFPLTIIGQFVGHRSAASTQIYSKVAIEALREVALGNGEEVL